MENRKAFKMENLDLFLLAQTIRQEEKLIITNEQLNEILKEERKKVAQKKYRNANKEELKIRRALR